MAVRALRGAITVDVDEPMEIRKRTSQLLAELFERNRLAPGEVVSVFFTATDDLRSVAPAAGARDFGLTDVPLLCATEMPVDGSLERCIRLLVHLDVERSSAELRHVFLREATVLRPEWTEPGDAEFDSDLGAALVSDPTTGP